MDLVSVAGLKAKALRVWEEHKILRAELAGVDLFPLEIPFRKPVARDMQENFRAVQDWVRALRAGSRAEQGAGYELEFRRVNYRRVGEQDLPARIYFRDRDDFLCWIDRDDMFRKFQRESAGILERRPQLRDWLISRPDRVLAYRGEWERLLAICEVLEARPRPDVYMRQLSLPDVDTKFMEQRRAVLAELFDVLLPAAAVQTRFRAGDARGFAQRFGFRYEEALIRARILDPRLAERFGGLRDLSVPVSDFGRDVFFSKNVFITENKLNGLSFPDVENAIVVFGLGYGILALKEVPWLPDSRVVYWGDIDTHGFQILARLRRAFPGVRSLLMDRETLMHFRERWGRENTNQRCLVELDSLEPEEARLFDDLREDRLGTAVRLEQERIDYAFARLRIQALVENQGWEAAKSS